MPFIENTLSQKQRGILGFYQLIHKTIVRVSGMISFKNKFHPKRHATNELWFKNLKCIRMSVFVITPKVKKNLCEMYVDRT